MQEAMSDKILLLIIDKLAIGLLILVAGYFVNKTLERFRGEQALRKEYESLRDRTALTHLQRQIEELYSPLLGLLTQSKIVFDIAEKKLPNRLGGQAHTSPEEDETWRYFVEHYFLPLNKQMADLVRTKVYLIPTDAMPESFNLFLMHQAQFDCLHALWRDKGISSMEVPGIGWPKGFQEDVKQTLASLRKTHNENLRRIERMA